VENTIADSTSSGLIKAVELGDQDHQHQEHRQQERPPKEAGSLGLLLGLSAEAHAQFVGQRIVRQRGLEPADLIVNEQTSRRIGGDRQGALTVDPLDDPGLRRRVEFHEIHDRHQPIGGGHAQVHQLREVALVERKTHPDIDLLVGVIGPVAPKPDTLRNHLHRVAKQADVSPVARRLTVIHLHAQFHAGQ
jgi:hypothetical protein